MGKTEMEHKVINRFFPCDAGEVRRKARSFPMDSPEAKKFLKDQGKFLRSLLRTNKSKPPCKP